MDGSEAATSSEAATVPAATGKTGSTIKAVERAQSSDAYGKLSPHGVRNPTTARRHACSDSPS